MAIVYNENKKTFSLHTARTTYQLKIGNLNYVKHLYYGATIRDEDLVYLIRQYDRGFSGNPYDSLKERTFSLDAQPQEFTTQQQGDFRINSIEVQNSDGSFSFNGRYVSHRMYHGPFTLQGLPTAFATENDTVDSLELTIEDAVTNVQVTLLYSVFEEADIIMRAARVHNGGKETIQLKRIMSLNMDYMNGQNLDLISLPGRYGQERQVERQPLTHHVHKIRSGRGISSHQQNPFIALAERTTTEDFGACYGFALMYSGSFLAEVELDQYDQARLVMGINDRLFSYPVDPGEDFDTPAVLMTYTHKGLTRMSQNYHNFIRNNLNKSKFVRDVRRPVLINTWEAAFFDFDDEKLIEIAKAAKGMGVEMIVMDDGWFGKRDDDNSGLGDWYDLGPKGPGYSQLTPNGLTATATYFSEVQTMQQIAELLLHKEDAQRFNALADSIRTAYCALFDTCQSQTALCMGLSLNLLPDSLIPWAQERLLADLATPHTTSDAKGTQHWNTLLTAGDIGYVYLVRTLAALNRHDLLLQLCTRSDIPGYGMQLAKGATSLTESWQALSNVSNNHLMLGHILEWLYGYVAGIRKVDGRYIVQPADIPGIDHCDCTYPTPNGPIHVHWERRNDGSIEIQSSLSQ